MRIVRAKNGMERTGIAPSIGLRYPGKRLRARCLISSAILIAAVAAGPKTVSAQLVEEEKPDRWSFQVNLALAGYSGNQSLMMMSSGMSVSHLQTNLFEFDVSGRIDYSSSGGEEIARNVTGSIKFDLYPEADWSPFIFSTAQHIPTKNLHLRVNGGMGAKWTFWRLPAGNVSISLAGLYSYEDYGVKLKSTMEQFDRKARLSWRLKGANTFSSGISIEHIFYYQPRWSYTPDYLVDVDTTLSIQLSQILSLTVNHHFERDSQAPARNAQKDDHYFNVGLKLRW